jgi:aryl-alcohol dehydrogenase
LLIDYERRLSNNDESISQGEPGDDVMQVSAAVCRAPGADFSIEDLTLEDPRDDEMLVKIAGVGLCHSDLLASEGVIPIALPAVFGHEGAGEVVAVGRSVKGAKPGDHVILTFGSCGVCGRCVCGDFAYCDSSAPLNYSGGRRDGSSALHAGKERVSSHFFGPSSFSSMVLSYERNAVVIPGDLPIAVMGPLGCGVQTGAGAIINSLKCHADSSLLITGGGSLGLSAVLAAVIRGCSKIIVVEPHQSRRALALELGATHVIDPATDDLSKAVRDVAPAGVDFAFDSTAIPAVLGAAVASLGMRGSLAMAGVPSNPATAIALPVLPMVGMGQTIRGLVEGDSNPAEFIPYLVSLYREGRFPFDKLVKTYPFEQINQAVADHRGGKCVKAVLLPTH